MFISLGATTPDGKGSRPSLQVFVAGSLGKTYGWRDFQKAFAQMLTTFCFQEEVVPFNWCLLHHYHFWRKQKPHKTIPTPGTGLSLQNTCPGLEKTHITGRGQGSKATGQGPNTVSLYQDREAISLAEDNIEQGPQML